MTSPPPGIWRRWASKHHLHLLFRPVANVVRHRDIQDQAGNDLDGINSGIGGQDATFNINPGYTTPTVTLATWNGTATVWNSSMPLVFAPTFPAGSIQSIATTNISGTPSTVFTFTKLHS